MRAPSDHKAAGAAASALGLGLVILAAGHLLLYVVLTADARSALASASEQHEPAQLVGAKDPGHPPQPGTEAYSTWLRSYELWFASKDYAVHGRHETLVKTGMILSFLIGLGLLGQGWMRASRRQSAPQSGSGRARSRRPARVVPLRPVGQPVAARPIAVRPIAIARAETRHRKSA
jgi:hypothetical protein